MSIAKQSGNALSAAFKPLFEPEAIAVVGASATGTTAGNRFIRLLKSGGFSGRIFPIHPSASEIEGLPACSTLADMPEIADYAYLTIPAERTVEVLASAGGKLRFAQVMASGAPETHHAWEQELRDVALRGGFRLIGPNCMGTHSPRGRYTFMEGAGMEEGEVGIACQSGGLGMDILRRGQNLGLRFSGLVTLGNSIDVSPSDLFEYYLEDPGTKVIGLYIEDVKDGERFQKLARHNRGGKPVVLLVGGITGLGRKAAASHTGAMGGTAQAWQALSRQTGVILTETLDAFLDALQVCLWLSPKRGRPSPSVTLFGNGGGTSVLATDSLDRAGFQLAVPTKEARAEYSQITLPPGASLENPIDLPASVLKEQEGRVTAHILDIDRRHTKPYATIIHLNLPVIMGYRHVAGFLPNLMASVFGFERAADEPHRILVIRSDRSEEADAWRRNFREVAAQRGVPTFDEIPQAIEALAVFRRYESFLSTAEDGGFTTNRAASYGDGV
jgi:acyl-CoA synthetase (NDP forming)